MTATPIRPGAFLVCAGLLLFAACDDNRSPARPGPPPRLDPLTPPSPVVAGIELAGPRTLAPGQTASFTATARFTDGSSGDVTGQARWGSNGVVRIDAPGQVTANQRGDATITVEFDRVTSVMDVIVVPEGTYRISGVVSVAAVTGVVLGARVEVLDVPERLETFTNVEGKYVLFGVPGRFRIRITRAGYVTLEEIVQVQEHRSVDFVATLVRPLPDLSGTYTLRITLTTPCGDNDPGPEFRDRTYRATITHWSPTDIVVSLTGANMAVWLGMGDRFSGTVEPSGARFYFDRDYYSSTYPRVVERLPNGTYLVVSGWASTTLVTEGLIGTLSGRLLFYSEQPNLTFPPSVSCGGKDIRFALLK